MNSVFQKRPLFAGQSMTISLLEKQVGGSDVRNHADLWNMYDEPTEESRRKEPAYRD